MFDAKCAIVLASLTICTAIANASERCRPSEHLLQDTYRLDHQTELSLTLAREDLEDRQRQRSGRVVASYGGYSFDAKDARVAIDRIQRLMQMELNERQKIALQTSVLSDNAVRAYIACLDSTNQNYIV